MLGKLLEKQRGKKEKPKRSSFNPKKLFGIVNPNAGYSIRIFSLPGIALIFLKNSWKVETFARYHCKKKEKKKTLIKNSLP